VVVGALFLVTHACTLTGVLRKSRIGTMTAAPTVTTPGILSMTSRVFLAKSKKLDVNILTSVSALPNITTVFNFYEKR